MIEVRRAGEIPTFDTRADANEKVDRQKRYSQIIGIMKSYNRPMTAKEIAVSMNMCGYTSNKDRNNSSPRLTELTAKGIVEPAGKVKCRWTGRTVTAYRLREEA